MGLRCVEGTQVQRRNCLHVTTLHEIITGENKGCRKARLVKWRSEEVRRAKAGRACGVSMSRVHPSCAALEISHSELNQGLHPHLCFLKIPYTALCVQKKLDKYSMDESL